VLYEHEIIRETNLAPQAPVVAQKKKHKHHLFHRHEKGAVNTKDIRETELYQENYAGERVHEGGALAGMPLDRLSRPLAEGSGQVTFVEQQPITTVEYVSQQPITTTYLERPVETTYIERPIETTYVERPIETTIIEQPTMVTSAAAPSHPHHRTEIEHFGAHQDRLEMDQYAMARGIGNHNPRQYHMQEGGIESAQVVGGTTTYVTQPSTTQVSSIPQSLLLYIVYYSTSDLSHKLCPADSSCHLRY